MRKFNMQGVNRLLTRSLILMGKGHQKDRGWPRPSSSSGLGMEDSKAMKANDYEGLLGKNNRKYL